MRPSIIDGEMRFSEEAINARLPFELIPDETDCEGKEARDGKPTRAVLLIHGLLDSAFVMRDIGERFKEECFLVRAILLPGHGTVPGDLLRVNAQEWIEATHAGVESFADLELDALYLVGFSVGGALSVQYAQDPQRVKNANVKGLILLAPTISPKRLFSGLADWRETYNWAYKRANWIEVHLDKDPMRYESFAKNAQDQIGFLAWELGNPDSKDGVLPLPVFIAMTAQDNSTSAAAVWEFFQNRVPAHSVLLWYMRNPSEPTTIIADGKQIIKIESASPRECEDGCVIDFAHISIPGAPSNSHYGEGGDYKSCLHYRHPNGDADIQRKLIACETSNDPDVVYGENLIENVDRYTLRRLSYNLDFERMTRTIFSFVDNLE
jgi:esterase/lipase